MSTNSRTDKGTHPTVDEKTTRSWFGRTLLLAVAIVAVGATMIWLLSQAGSETAPELERANAAVETPSVTADVGHPAGGGIAASALLHDLPCTPQCVNLAATLPIEYLPPAIAHDLPCTPQCVNLAATLPIEYLPPAIAHDLPCTPTCENLAAAAPPATLAARYDLPCTPTCSG